MKCHIDFTQPSTIRGAVWLIAGIVGLIFVMPTHNLEGLIYLASAISGGLGVAISDKP